MPVQIIRVTPYDRTGFLLPLVLQRITEFNRQHMTEAHPESLSRAINARLALNDPQVILLAGVGAKGDVVAHVVGTLEEDPTDKSRWVFVWQCRVDPGEGSSDPTLVRRFIEAGDEWGNKLGAKQMLMSTPRNDEAWRRKYGFQAYRTTCGREIGSPIQAPDKKDQ